MRAVPHEALFPGGRELLNLRGGLSSRLDKSSSRLVERSLTAVDVGFEIADNRFVRAVLHEALFPGGRELLNLRGGLSSRLDKSSSRLVERSLTAVDVGFEIADNRFVRAVLHEALFLGGSHLLQLCNHCGNLIFRLILGLIHLFLNDLEGFLEILDNFVVGCSTTNGNLLPLLELLDLSLTLCGGFNERGCASPQLALEVCGG